MAYRVIDENFLRSKAVRRLSDQGKLAYLYLFSTGKLSGVIYKAEAELAAGIGWPVKKWRAAVQELLTEDRVSIGYSGEILWVKRHIEHQWLSYGRKISPKIKKAIQKEVLQLPQDPIILEVVRKYADVFEAYPIDRVSDTVSTVGVNEPIPNQNQTKIKASCPKSGFSDEAKLLTSTFIARMLQNNPEAKVPVEGNGRFVSWVDVFDKILRIDKKDCREVEKRIHWCQGDNFWKKNCLSPESLRRHYDRFTLEMRDEGWRKPPESDEDRRKRILSELPEGT